MAAQQVDQRAVQDVLIAGILRVGHVVRDVDERRLLVVERRSQREPDGVGETQPVDDVVERPIDRQRRRGQDAGAQAGEDIDAAAAR